MITTNTIWNSTLRWWNTSLRWYLGECRYDRLWKDILSLSFNPILTWDVVLRRHLSLSLGLTLRCNSRLTWDVVLRCQLSLSQNLTLERNTAVCLGLLDLRWDSNCVCNWDSPCDETTIFANSLFDFLFGIFFIFGENEARQLVLFELTRRSRSNHRYIFDHLIGSNIS